MEDEAWADITAAADQAVKEADAAIARICRERGIPENFRPEIHLSWWERGENACKIRRAELRKVAQTQVAAIVKEAKVEIEREQERQLTQLAVTGLTSAEATAFLGNMPSAEALLPPLEALSLSSGEVVMLGEPQSVTADRDRNAVVTVDRNGVADDVQGHNACVRCSKALAPGRGRYCSNRCRQATYRQRRRLQATGCGANNEPGAGNDKATARLGATSEFDAEGQSDGP
jgi:predicted nucleic acid-binding Zn ribbon protein